MRKSHADSLFLFFRSLLKPFFLTPNLAGSIPETAHTPQLQTGILKPQNLFPLDSLRISCVVAKSRVFSTACATRLNAGLTARYPPFRATIRCSIHILSMKLPFPLSTKSSSHFSATSSSRPTNPLCENS